MGIKIVFTKSFWKKVIFIIGSILTAGLLLWIKSRSTHASINTHNIEKKIDLHPTVEVKKKIDLRERKGGDN